MSSLAPRMKWSSAPGFALIFAAAALGAARMMPATPSPARLAEGARRRAALFGRMWPPGTDPGFLTRMGGRQVETMQTALPGTVRGSARNLPIAWCASRTVSPVPRAAIPFKALASVLRTVPGLV